MKIFTHEVTSDLDYEFVHNDTKTPKQIKAIEEWKLRPVTNFEYPTGCNVFLVLIYFSPQTIFALMSLISGRSIITL